MKKTLYFYINGSGSPFWLEERENNVGGIYYWDLYWPENPSEEFKNSWRKISVLFETYNNPIDRTFPSLWTQSLCDVFNQIVGEFIRLSQIELPDYNIVNRYCSLNQDGRLIAYRQDILKSHLENNKIINDLVEFESYFKYRKEFNAILSSELPYDTNFRISQSEYDTLNRIRLRFGLYDNFEISVCPFSFRTFITDINIGGHFPVYQLMRISREDILNQQKKIIELSKNLLN